MMKFRARSKSSKDSRSTFNPQQQQRPEQYPVSPRAVAPTPPQGSLGSHLEERKHSFEGKHISVPISSDGIIYHDDNRRQRSRSVGKSRSSSVSRHQHRSRSASRPTQSLASETHLRIVGRDEQRVERDESLRQQRSQSNGRSSRAADDEGDSSEEHSSDKPQRKSKLEKIRQLQAKNELYKEEFKRVQKDRKKLKKELEARNNEIVALTREIDMHIEETSHLKSQLADALIRIERGDGRSDREAAVPKIAKELSQTKEELAAALRRVSTLKDELADMREFVRRKDEQIESLSQEVSSLETEVNSLRVQSTHASNSADQSKMVHDLVEENRKIQEELGSTLERATTMVKEREEAIADLLKENDDLKALLLEQDQSIPEISSEELEHLHNELHRLTKALEEAQDRNLLLEEEVEGWMARGRQMESTMDRINNDLETWQEKAEKSEKSVALLEGEVVDARADAASAREACRDVEARFKSEIEQLRSKHHSEITELQERAFAERVEKSTVESPQAMLLQQAVADRMKKSMQASSWRKFLKAGDEEESLDDNQKRIRELEVKNSEQEEEIKSLKSDLVRLRSSYNEAAYVSKKKIDQLSDENEAYAQKVKSLEEMLSVSDATG